jgi:hypothetical protein
MISISQALLSNTKKFGVLPMSRDKRVEEYRCRVPSRDWVLGIFYPLARLQDI